MTKFDYIDDVFLPEYQNRVAYHTDGSISDIAEAIYEDIMADTGLRKGSEKYGKDINTLHSIVYHDGYYDVYSGGNKGRFEMFMLGGKFTYKILYGYKTKKGAVKAIKNRLYEMGVDKDIERFVDEQLKTQKHSTRKMDKEK